MQLDKIIQLRPAQFSSQGIRYDGLRGVRNLSGRYHTHMADKPELMRLQCFHCQFTAKKDI